MDTTTCPECGTLAEILWRTVLESTDGPVEHCKVVCLRRHWFMLPTGSLPEEQATPIGGHPGPFGTSSRPRVSGTAVNLTDR